MASVDDRIVSMKFDNNAFESKIATTITSIEKLKGSLDFANSKRGMDDLTTASNNFNLQGMASAVESISGKFSTMGAVAFSVIQNIVNRATTAGIQLAKALSLDQVKAGFSDYELKIGATQTIMAGTGENIDTVTAALKELDTYADKTIYNLADMVGNISKFTNAGVKLPVATKAMIGIANAAALAGASSGEAARAMYNLGQAIGQGNVRLIDWKSVELANMGTMEFKQQLIDSAVAMGSLTKASDGTLTTLKGTIVTTKNFSTTLDDLWLTSEALTMTLGNYADQTTAIGKKSWAAAQDVKSFSMMMETLKASISTGWTDTFEIIIGNLPEAKKLWTNLTNAMGSSFGKASDARNEMLQGWKELGGRDLLLDALTDAVKGLATVLKPIKEAFRSIFPKQTADSLFKITQSFHELVQNFTISKPVAEAIKSVFEGLFSAFKIGWEIVRGIAGVFADLFNSVSGFDSGTGGILGFLAKLGETFVTLKEILVDSGAISKFFNDISGSISRFIEGLSFGNIVDRVLSIFGKIKDAIVGLFDGVNTEGDSALSKLGDRFGWLFDLVKRLIDIIQWFADKISGVWHAIGKSIDWLADKFKGLPQMIADVFAKADYNQVLDTVNVGLFAALVLAFKKFVSNGLKFDVGNGFFANLSSIGKNISKSFNALTGTLTAMQNNIKADTLLKIATAVGILTISMVVLAAIDSASLTKALVAMAFGFGELVATMALLDRTTGGMRSASKLAILGAALILLATSMTILAVAVKIFSTMSWSELVKGLAGVGIALTIVTAAMNLAPSGVGMISQGLGMIAIATALTILAGAVKLFALMSWKEIGKGLAAIAGGLVIIALAMHLMPNGPGMVLKGAGLIEIAIALTILAGAIKLFALMSWKEIGKGLATIAGSLLIIAGAMNLMPNGLNLALQGAGLLLISMGLIGIAGAIKILGGMSWENMAKGLAGIAVTLGLLAAATNLMQGTIGGAIAIGIVAVSLGILSKVVKEFAEIKWQDLLRGLGGIAAIFAVLGIAALLLKPVIPALFGLGAALALIGAGFALFGLGANLVATAFAIIATSGTQGVAVLLSALEGLIILLPKFIGAFGEGLLILAQKVLDALPAIIGSLDEIIVAFLQLIIDTMPKMAETITVFIRSMLTVIRDLFPDFVKTGFALLMEFLRGIRDNVVEITATVVEIILKFLNELTAHIGELVKAGAEVLVALLKGIADNLGSVLAAAGSIITEFIKGLGNLAKDIVTAGADALVSFLTGIAEAIPKISEAVTDIITAFLTAISAETPKIVNAFFQMFIDLFNGLADVINQQSGELGKAMGRLVSALVKGIGNALKEAIKQIANDLFPGLGSVVSGILDFFGIASPSKLFYWIGEQLMLGFATGIDDNFARPVNSLMAGSDTMVGTMSNTMTRLSDVLDQNMDFNPTIAPVLDLTNVEREAARLSGILNTTSMDAALSYKQAASLSITSRTKDDVTVDTTAPIAREIKFEQNNYSPQSLSTAEIYRQTRNQIAMAKEELAVL